MARKFKVEANIPTEIFIINIACQKPDYWIAYKINELLPFNFTRTDDLEIYHPPRDITLKYSLFYHHIPDARLTYYLISNHNPEGKLFPVQKTSDYFYLVSGTISESEKHKILNGIKKIPYVLAAYNQSADSFKNIEEFIAELELQVIEKKTKSY